MGSKNIKGDTGEFQIWVLRVQSPYFTNTATEYLTISYINTSFCYIFCGVRCLELVVFFSHEKINSQQMLSLTVLC